MPKWVDKELNMFTTDFQYAVDKLESEGEKRRFELEFEEAVGDLKRANQYFTVAIWFASIVVVLFLLLDLRVGGGLVVMLFFAPYFISSLFEERAQPNLVRRVENKALRRQIFANAVGGIALALFVANQVVRWGFFDY